MDIDQYRKEKPIMDLQPATPLSDKTKQTRTAIRRRGLPYMSETQIQAYFIARDLMRRIQRTASMEAALPNMITEQREQSKGAQL